jgi:hypothetical protein
MKQVLKTLDDVEAVFAYVRRAQLLRAQANGLSDSQMSRQLRRIIQQSELPILKALEAIKVQLTDFKENDPKIGKAPVQYRPNPYSTRPTKVNVPKSSKEAQKCAINTSKPPTLNSQPSSLKKG